jgi:hypothetical protein
MNIFDLIFNHPELINKPPVLLDIGASGETHSKWKSIAKYSICVAFDADKREMDSVLQESSDYKKLYIYPCIVTDENSGEKDFYLTQSPYCSSLLKPNQENLNNYAFADLFKVEVVEKIQAKELRKVIQELDIWYVDWYKSDSQGTDLRLFKNLGQDIINNVLIAEFEPGIIDAYDEEDKLHSILSYMDKQPFWMSEIEIKGSQRMRTQIMFEYLSISQAKNLDKWHKISPGWAEVTYFNQCKLLSSKRDFFLAWIFSMLEKQYGFALEISFNAQKKYDDDLFGKMTQETLKQIKRSELSAFASMIGEKLLFNLKKLLSKLNHHE